MSRRPGALAPPTRTHYIWCSRHNPGALEVVNELKHAGGYEGRLLVTEEPGAMAEADHVLLYLSLATWKDDGQRKTELAAEVKEALLAGRKLLLVHETDEERGGVQQFGHFFGDDQTPGELLGLKIYAEIAIGMKAPPYRTVSLGLFDQAVRAGETGRRSWLSRAMDAAPQGQQAPSDLAARRWMQVLATPRGVGRGRASSTACGAHTVFSRVRQRSTAGDASARVSTELHSTRPSTAATPRGWARSLIRCSVGTSEVDQERISLREEDSAADTGTNGPGASSKGRAAVHPDAAAPRFGALPDI